MRNNDILRRLRYAFDLPDAKMISIFEQGLLQTNHEQVASWLKKEDHEEFQQCSDSQLAAFLNGFIIQKRGKKEGAQPTPEESLSNNQIFMKLKIALNLKAEDVINIMEMADFKMSKHELSAFFRRVGHKHYRECKDQILRYFLKGIQIQYRPSPAEQ